MTEYAIFSLNPESLIAYAVALAAAPIGVLLVTLIQRSTRGEK